MPIQRRKTITPRGRAHSAPEPLVTAPATCNAPTSSKKKKQHPSAQLEDATDTSSWRLFYGNNVANFADGLAAHATEAGVDATKDSKQNFWTDSDAHLEKTLQEFGLRIKCGLDPWRACAAIGRNFRMKKIESDSHFGTSYPTKSALSLISNLQAATTCGRFGCQRRSAAMDFCASSPILVSYVVL